MKSVLYISLMEDFNIPEEHLYQIFLHLYKNNDSGKELILTQIRNDSTISFFKRDENKILEEKISIDKSIEEFLKELEKDHYICIMITNMNHVKSVGNLIDEIITLNKGEFIRPLCVL